MKEIAVIGAGQMGSGIAQVCASKNYLVYIWDISDSQLESSKSTITKSLNKFVAKKKISTLEQKNTLEKIITTNDLEQLANCDLIIEAIVENENHKKDIFSKLDKIVKKSAIFSSNTSSISISRLASSTNRAEKFIGIHFMNPVPIMNLVEIIPTIQTSEQTLSTTKDFVNKLNKTTVISKDYPGFIINRILMPMINEAFDALMTGLSSPEEIDQAMKLGCNFPMGPLQLADFIGLDTCLAIMKVLQQGIGGQRYHPSPLLQNYVDNNHLGKKTSKGVYTY
jgi:3-hydroxybutyryl-CoA dehydrogenase